jgi:hypothetical protein
MISIKQRGDFSKAKKYLLKISKTSNSKLFDEIGRKGVSALSSATPVDTGKTAASWSYEITKRKGRITISFNNSNIVKHVNIAIILQYGHGTRNGGWVQGRDYINPALQPVFDEFAKEAWEEVTKV